ncbi:MAG: NAD(P)(+) transhydrogenase (Re/Si-specific) subunit beta [Ignavibacteria bacterium]|nr:NAD(P)(+) transhydrogenase (Re/Si-specific) subunit beta [Ignavibacteria bacterium]MBI3765650.1 NAD(P)(+) transhydrogenase (Re/Si-specific) subunit beta [Ignavibacteriales bacterium]
MTTELEIGLYIFMLAGFLGYHVITRVPPLLHTPLMSATNAIAGISLVGSLVVAGADYGPLSTALGFIAVTCSSTNVVGGFLITDRMLKMFKTTKDHTTQRHRFQFNPRLLVTGLVVVVGLFVLTYLSDQVRKDVIYLFRDVLPSHALRYFYVVSAALFILGLKGLSSPKYARKGMHAAAVGMLMAIVGTLFHHEIVMYKWIIIGLIIGSIVGGAMGLRIPMTAVPQRTALSHSLGALAACLVGISEYFHHHGDLSTVVMTPLGFEVVIGGLTFTGSLMAAAKLQGILPGHPITYKGQNIFNLSLLGVIITSLIYLVFMPPEPMVFKLMVGLSFVFGLLLVIPIGAADMPVVIALLNSYGGLADASMGFVLMNKIQIITGSLDGTSGFLLSLLMCRAMNRSAINVLFGAFGKVAKEESGVVEAKGTVRSITAEEMAALVDGIRSIVIVPGYGMAVAQAQYGVAEFAKVLMKRGIDVKYAIHPVAGRMPGHMNVLLAEANVPYDQLYEMEQINPYFAQADVALVVGANDVTNPAAKYNKNSPLYGMPILDVERAKSIVVLKRSLAPGFSGVENELYYNPRCMMLFGDAKESLNKLFAALKS